jgi:hypothetical protein
MAEPTGALSPWRPAAEKIAVHFQIVRRHPDGGEAFLKYRTASVAIDCIQTGHRRNGLFHGIHNKSSDAIGQNLWDRTAPTRDHRRPTGERFDQHQAERLFPLNWE